MRNYEKVLIANLVLIFIAAGAMATDPPSLEGFVDAKKLLEGVGLQVDEEQLGPAALEVLAKRADPGSLIFEAAEATRIQNEQKGLVFHPGITFAYSNSQAYVLNVFAEGDGGVRLPQVGDAVLEVKGEELSGRHVTFANSLLKTSSETSVVLRLAASVEIPEEGAAESDDDTEPAGDVTEAEAQVEEVTLEEADVEENMEAGSDEKVEEASVSGYEMTVESKLLQMPSIAGADLRAGGLAYVKLYGLFQENSKELLKRLNALLEEKVSGLILDLRDAGGDDLEAVNRLSGMFVESEVLLHTRINISSGERVEFFGTADADNDMPVMVLVDDKTSGAAELLAGIFKSRVKKVLLIGQPTAADPLTRSFVELPEGRSLYIAARYYTTPDEVKYDGHKPIEPDLLVEADTDASYGYRADPNKKAIIPKKKVAGIGRKLRSWTRADNILTTAVNILLGINATKLHATDS